jgi:hypothetical protein
MSFDPKNNLTWTSMFVSKAQATNNQASVVLDLKEYEGPVAVRVNIGIKSVGDNDGTIAVFLQESATNSASNAHGANISGSFTNTTNNTASSATILLDPRARLRYIFGRIVLTGTNTPTYPVSMEAAGIKQVQP